MTDAERQARYRAVRASGAPVIRTRRPADHRSRARRRDDTVAEITKLQAEYDAWLQKPAGEPARYRDSRILARDQRIRHQRVAGDRAAARLRSGLSPRQTKTAAPVAPSEAGDHSWRLQNRG